MGRPTHVHGDLSRHLGQDLYLRLHIYPTLAGANADATAKEARLIYIASTQSVWYGQPGAWVELARASGAAGLGGPFQSPGALPIRTVRALGAITAADPITGDITLAALPTGIDAIKPGDFLAVSGSADNGAAPFLDGAYYILSVDDALNVVNVGAGVLNTPALPVASFGVASAYTGAPTEGAMAVVNPDPAIDGPALWVFDGATNSWLRHNDQDTRIVLRDASRNFSAFPSVDALAGAPTNPRHLITADFLADELVATLAQAAASVPPIAEETISTEHELPTVLVSGVAITSIDHTQQRVLMAVVPPDARKGMTIVIAGTATSNGSYTIYDTGVGFIQLKAGALSASEGAGGTFDLVQGYDHNAASAVSADGLQAHIDDVTDPHAAAGYQTQSEVDARIGALVPVLAPSRAEVQVAVQAGVTAHDNSPTAHGSLVERLDAVVDQLNEEDGALWAPVDLGATPAANGLPLTSVSGVWKPIAANTDVVGGLLEQYTPTQAVGVCTASSNAGAKSITLTAGLTGADFVPGHGYKFPGISADLLVIDYIDGNTLYLIVAPPTVGSTPGINVTEHPVSKIITSGILVVSTPRTRIADAGIIQIQRTGSGTDAAFRVVLAADEPVGAVRPGDDVVIAGHTFSPGKNGAFVVESVDAGANSIGLRGAAGTVFGPVAAAVEALTRKLTLAAYTSFERMYVGQTLTIAGSGSGNNGTYTVEAFDRFFKAIIVAETLAADEASVNVTVTGANLIPYNAPDTPAVRMLVGLAPGNDTILALNDVTGEIEVCKGSLPFAAPGRSLAIYGVIEADNSYAISAVNTAAADRDVVTVTGLLATYTRPVGAWGSAGVVGYDFNNVASIDVDNGSGDGEITFTNAVLGSVLTDDTLELAGAGDADGSYIVLAVVSPTVVRVRGGIPGLDQTGLTTTTAIIYRSNVENGLVDASYAGATTGFDATAPATPKAFYADVGDAQLLSATATSRHILAYQIDQYTAIVRITPPPLLPATPVRTASIAFADSPYTVPADIEAVLVDASGGNVLVNLPVASIDRKIEIAKTDVSVNTVTADGNGTEPINGALTQVLTTQYSGMRLRGIVGAWYRY